jgi:hypothetical protein
MAAKNRHPFFIKAKKPPTKKLQGCQLFEFPRFLHHTFFDNSTSFYCRNFCLGALERYSFKQNSKNNNNNLKKKVGFDHLKWNYSKCNFFKNLNKLPMNDKYMTHSMDRPSRIESNFLNFIRLYLRNL